MITAINPVYNSYNRISFGMMTPKRKAMTTDSYNTINKEFDSRKSSQELKEKYSPYPISIKGIVLLLPEYLEGRMNSKTFAKNCLERTPVLLTRIELTKDGKEFKSSYQREISLIKSLNDTCNKYNNGAMTKSDFDFFTEIHAQNFLKTQSPKTHKFLN